MTTTFFAYPLEKNNDINACVSSEESVEGRSVLTHDLVLRVYWQVPELCLDIRGGFLPHPTNPNRLDK